jgi:hypothetical protein
MPEQASFSSNIAAVAQAFAAISERAAKQSNIDRLRIAEGNIAAGTAQIELEETTQRKKIARAFALHQGQVVAEAAYRGGGEATATERAAATAASEEVAIVTANAAAKRGALTASQAIILEDPFLARLEGGLRGREIGSTIAKSMLESADIVERRSARGLGPLPGGRGEQFQKLITTFADIKGFDFGDLLNF